MKKKVKSNSSNRKKVCLFTITISIYDHSRLRPIGGREIRVSRSEAELNLHVQVGDLVCRSLWQF